jgi:hypothetical protein
MREAVVVAAKCIVQRAVVSVQHLQKSSRVAACVDAHRRASEPLEGEPRVRGDCRLGPWVGATSRNCFSLIYNRFHVSSRPPVTTFGPGNWANRVTIRRVRRGRPAKHRSLIGAPTRKLEASAPPALTAIVVAAGRIVSRRRPISCANAGEMGEACAARRECRRGADTASRSRI